MKRLLVILALAAVLLQCCAVGPLMPDSLADSRSEMTLAAAPVSTAASIVLRRVSPLEPLLGKDAGLAVAWHFDAASANWLAVLESFTTSNAASDDSLQALGIRWQI
jgi:hypothetical protein